MGRRKPAYPTCTVTVGGVAYTVHLRVIPGRAAARVGADSPRYLDPGSKPKASVIRILRDGIEMTGSDLLYFTRRAIEAAAVAQFAGGACYGAGHLARAMERTSILGGSSGD